MARVALGRPAKQGQPVKVQAIPPLPCDVRENFTPPTIHPRRDNAFHAANFGNPTAMNVTALIFSGVRLRDDVPGANSVRTELPGSARRREFQSDSFARSNKVIPSIRHGARDGIVEPRAIGRHVIEPLLSCNRDDRIQNILKAAQARNRFAARQIENLHWLPWAVTLPCSSSIMRSPRAMASSRSW